MGRVRGHLSCCFSEETRDDSASGSNAAVPALTLVKGTLKMITWIKVRTAFGLAASVLLIAGLVTVTVSTVSRAQETPAEVQQHATLFPGPLVGIGAELRAGDTYPSVVEIVKGGPADRDGRLKVNDRIAAVAQGDGAFVDSENMALPKVVELIRGKEGTTVRLQVIAAGAADAAAGREEISLVRAKIVIAPAGSPVGN